MFCPRCGAESEEGDRYCASCGSELPREGPADRQGGEEKTGSARHRLTSLIGTTRRARLVTLGTALAVVVAAIAFVALDPSDDSTVPQDAYNLAIDQNCVRHKKQIAAAQRDALALGGQAGVSRFADSLVPIAGEWRMDLGRATVPIDRSEAVAALDTALLEVEIQAGTLARVAREADGRATLASAARVDAASQQVEAAVEALELERCELLSVEVGSLVQR